ncbi:MAG TPA: hypothetical protein DEF33_09060 [Clostridiales bacterium]|nr:hypothetical protein [Clostridiales bacterium]
MKRFFLMWWLVIALLLSGCGSSASRVETPTGEPVPTPTPSGCGSSASRVETLKSWSFQYNEGTSDYSLFFGLADKNDKPLSAGVDVDIRIVNDENEEVYTGTKSVSPDDFGCYTSRAAGEQYLANVRIPAAEIKAGKSESGKVYFTVYKGNALRFDEVNCDALYCLPIEEVQVTFDSFPLDLKMKDFMGGTASVIQIQGAEFKFDKDYIPKLTVTITGEKKSGSRDSGYDMISYKLYDSAGYLVDSGNIYLSSLSAGDKFKDDSVVIYDITPGESYTFRLSEYSR